MLRRIILAGFISASSAIAFAQVPASVVNAVKTQSQVPSPAQEAGARAAGIETPTAPAAATGTTSRPKEVKRADATSYIGLGVSLLNVRGYTGLMPKAYLGYSNLIGKNNNLFWAVEVFAGYGSWNLSGRNHRFRVTNVFGASLQKGVKFNEWSIIFVRAGGESAYYEKRHSTKIGGLFGIGLQTYMYEHWDFRAEYDYNTNKNLNQYNIDILYRFC